MDIYIASEEEESSQYLGTVSGAAGEALEIDFSPHQIFPGSVFIVGDSDMGTIFSQSFSLVANSAFGSTPTSCAGFPVPDDSCFGRCGRQTPSGCFCDALCEDFGDCCPDRCLCGACTNTCDGRCGQNDGDCGCGPGCEFTEQGCCADYCDMCPMFCMSEPAFCALNGCVIGGPFGDGDGCFCDGICISEGDCCPDACDVCGQCEPEPGDGSCAASGCGDAVGPLGDNDCWCDDACIDNTDCCFDACDECGFCDIVMEF